MARTAKATKKEIEESIAELRKHFPKGSTVYLILRHVSKSGMSRDIAPIAFLKNKPDDARYLWWHVSRVLGWRAITGGHDAVRVEGCGMDMGFHLVETLSRVLYGKGDALKHRWL